MASPSVRSSTESLESSDQTSHTVSLPATIESDDELLVIFCNDANDTVSWPSGWSSIFTAVNGSNSRLSIGRKDGGADGTEDGSTITVTTSGSEQSVHIAYAISGADVDTNIPEASTGATGTSNAPDPDTVTPAGGSDDYLFLACFSIDRDKETVTFPANMTVGSVEHGLESSATSNAAVTGGADTHEATASSFNPDAFGVGSSEGWTACAVAVYPVGVPPTGRIMSSLAGAGGLAGLGGIAGAGGGLAG